MSIGGFIKRSIFWTNDYIHGKKVRVFYNHLKTVLADEETGRPVQQKNLQDILKHATKNTMFYREFSGKDLSEFPVVNKNILNENREILGEDADISVEFVNDIPVLASGKRKPVICEWKK